MGSTGRPESHDPRHRDAGTWRRTSGRPPSCRRALLGIAVAGTPTERAATAHDLSPVPSRGATPSPSNPKAPTRPGHRSPPGAAVAGTSSSCEAADLAEQYARSGFDAIHLAGVLTLTGIPIIVATCDTRLVRAAQSSGLGTLPAELPSDRGLETNDLESCPCGCARTTGRSSQLTSPRRPGWTTRPSVSGPSRDMHPLIRRRGLG